MRSDSTHFGPSGFIGAHFGMARLIALVALALAAATLLQGCASKGERLADGDRIPPEIARIPDAVPKVEPMARYGNPDTYVVKGQRYRTLKSSRGYVERGLASWYGPNFHGRKTSSGEVYDMHAMTAAHKTLPLPTYAKVTNLENGRSVIIRINDRGPFHGPRVIDLSYTAAVKLGVYRKGTAKVEVRAIDPSNWSSHHGGLLAETTDSSPALSADSSATSAARASEPRKRPATSVATRTEASRTPPMMSATESSGSREPLAPAVASRTDSTRGAESLYLQLGAFGDPKNAERLRSRLKGRLASSQISVLDPGATGSALYKVRVGPLTSESDADRLTQEIAALGLERPKIIRD